MLVSIIMPSYNSERFILDSIRSVIGQTFQDWELLIIDDCSMDNSPEIIKEYAARDKRIKYLKTEKSSGSPALPRNIGIGNARGRFIAFLDSDDIWLPTKLEEQLNLFEEANVAIVYSNYEKIGDDGRRGKRVIINSPISTYRSLLKGNAIGNLTGIYDTQKVGKVYCCNFHHEDYLLWLSILKQGYVARNTNTVNALYRVRNNSVSSDKRKVYMWQWDIYIKIEHTGYLRALYYWCNYAYRAFKKSRI